MKFIHFADAHLDSPFRGLSFLPSKAFKEISQAANRSLERIVDTAISEQVDLVLIAGDTFDSNHPTPSSQLFFAKEIKRLTDAHIQVVMIFGNHDHMAEDELLVENSSYFKLLGSGEKVEKANFETRDGFKYDVVGFSYLNNHIEQDMMEKFPQKESNFTFGLMHAQEKVSFGENVYAPFTVAELVALNYDYFALGHIHNRRILTKSPLTVYPGNIQGRHINEMGEKGCYLGEVDETSNTVKIDFVETAPILWKQTEVEIKQEISKNQLKDLILSSLNPKKTTYYSLKLIGAQYLTEEERDLVEDSNFWLSISLELPYDSQLVDVRLETNEKLELSPADQAAFDESTEKVFNEEFWKIASDWSKKDALSSDLVNDPDFREEVKQLAEVKLANSLKGIDDET